MYGKSAFSFEHAGQQVEGGSCTVQMNAWKFPKSSQKPYAGTMMKEQTSLPPDYGNSSLPDRTGTSLLQGGNAVLDPPRKGLTQGRERTVPAARTSGKAEKGTNIHEALIEEPRLLFGEEPFHQIPKEALGVRLLRIFLDGRETAEKPLDVGIQDGGFPAVGQAENRSCSASANARKG